MQRTLFIGDVHGCLGELEDLLREAAVTPADRVVLLGDLVAKGPDSVGVVRLAQERGFLAVLGNHDAAVLRAAAGGDAKKEHQEVAQALSATDLVWLSTRPLILRLPELGVLAVHAGLVPGVPLEAQAREDLLTMRSLTREGRASRKSADGVPWASAWPGPEHVLFGHDAIRGLQRHLHATGLDTGCVYGRRLTGLFFAEERFVSVPARRAWRTP